ncbi:MAG: phosphopantothenate/pantothenate synthetase [Thermoproteota archaeon]|nr:phosphopantothenate/pantothenate synthetase [Thermoproteota archaeon]
MTNRIPPNHPRFTSLRTRQKLVDGLKKGLVVPNGLIAHGRGEAFDYLLGEQTSKTALYAEKVASCLLLLSKSPVISVNGNLAALCSKEIVELSRCTNASIEVNLFHRSQKRSEVIAKTLIRDGANAVLGIDPKSKFVIKDLTSDRRFVDKRGILSADTVFLAMEDGDRTEVLTSQGKTVVSVDLNPLSRTAQSSDVTIVDNVIRAIPNMILFATELSNKERYELSTVVSEFDNKSNLAQATRLIRYGV